MLIGIDGGGTKIEGVAMEPDGREVLRLRRDTPRHDYAGCLTSPLCSQPWGQFSLANFTHLSMTNGRDSSQGDVLCRPVASE